VTPRYDAVIVGSGPNGLVAAVTLARAGRSVMVLEAQERLGGAVATEELTLPGFRHDTFSAVHPAGAASPVLGALALERHGLRWIQPGLAMAHPFLDGRAAVLSRDRDRTARSLDALSPGDGARWLELVDPYLSHFEALRATLLSPFPPLTGPARLLARAGLANTLELARMLLMPADALGRELFQGEGRAWLHGSALHGDAPLNAAGSAILAMYLHLLGHAVGWPSPEGGAARLIDALVAHLAELGGDTRTGAAGERVRVRSGRVAAIEVAGGDTIETPVVIADTTPHGLLRLAGESLPGAYTRKLLRFRYGPGTFKVDWALNAPIPWENAEASHAGTVHVGGTSAEIGAALRDVERAQLPEHPFLLSGQQSIADPSRAPAGRNTAWAYTHVPDGVDWAVESERFADTVERQVERFAPGFRECVLARHVQSPADLERRNANLVRGDVGAGSNALDQLVFRPVPSLNPYRTPLRGLYLGSASTFPGGAVHGISGRGAARAAMRWSRLPRLG
jgi:phytoene dehydrogenase-like protein